MNKEAGGGPDGLAGALWRRLLVQVFAGSQVTVGEFTCPPRVVADDEPWRDEEELLLVLAGCPRGTWVNGVAARVIKTGKVSKATMAELLQYAPGLMRSLPDPELLALAGRYCLKAYGSEASRRGVRPKAFRVRITNLWKRVARNPLTPTEVVEEGAASPHDSIRAGAAAAPRLSAKAAKLIREDRTKWIRGIPTKVEEQKQRFLRELRDGRRFLDRRWATLNMRWRIKNLARMSNLRESEAYEVAIAVTQWYPPPWTCAPMRHLKRDFPEAVDKALKRTEAVMVLK